MTKLLFIVAAVVLAVLWFKNKGRAPRDIEAKKPADVEDMVRCRVCGVNLPRSEAILSQDRLYCCDEHRRQDQG